MMARRILQLGCPRAVKELILHLKKQGISAYPVGGCVRDALLGIPPHDWDLAVEAHPQTIMDVCKQGTYRVIPTGLQHGTVTVLTEAGMVECTACRSETGYADGRHPDQVTYTYRLSDDLSRRDFTVNAMAAKLLDDGNFEIVDLFGGQRDLEMHILACVGDPYLRFAEDALRLLRGIRFCVKLGFDMANTTYDALLTQKEGLQRVSRERVAEEFRKILCSPEPSRGVSLLRDTGLLPYVLSQGISPYGVGNLEELTPVFELRFGCLLWRMPADAVANMTNSLKLSNEEKRLVRMYANPTIPQGHDMIDARRMRHMYGQEATGVLQVARCRGEVVDDLMLCVKTSEALGECVQIKDLAVDGQDLMAVGVPQGAMLGVYLQKLLQVVMDNPAQNQKDCLIETVKTWLS